MTFADPTGRFPYASRRMPVWAENVVATSQPLATQAGIAALAEGGNAIDAALTAAIALTVVEPTSNGAGSDAFAMVWDGAALSGINGSGRSPVAWTPERFAGASAMPLTGWDSVTVPGAVDVWRRLSKRYGRLPFARLFAPAIRYARHGFPVSPITAHAWSRSETRLGGYSEFARVFLPGGRAPRTGEMFQNPDLAATLEAIAASGGEAFYRGAIAEAIAAASAREGGALTFADLAAHAALDVTPLSVPFRGVELHELPPNGQGLAALIALGVLERLPFEAGGPDSAETAHFMIEAMKVGVAEASRWIADPDAMRADPAALIAESRLDALAALVSPHEAIARVADLPFDRGTVYLAAADASGLMVSFIQSNFWGFGSGIVVAGTGIALQNRGAGFSLAADHPNRVAGGKRPFHTILPGFVTREGRPEMAFGVMGGAMQPQGHLQMMVRIFGFDQDVQAASDAPRWFVDADGTVSLERGFPDEVLDGLRGKGHSVRIADELLGGAQLVRRVGSAYVAASDSRKDGHAAGF